jgi:hypothetical protein
MKNVEPSSEGELKCNIWVGRGIRVHVDPPPPNSFNIGDQLNVLKSVVTEEFFRNIVTGTWITTKSIRGYKAVQKLLTDSGLPYFTFYSKDVKPVRAVIRHLPGSTSSEDIAVAFQKLDCDIISVKQMTAKRFATEEGSHISLSPSSYLR